MRSQSLFLSSSLVAVSFGLGIVACSDEERGVEEGSGARGPNNQGAESSGATTGRGGRGSSSGGRGNNVGGDDNVGAAMMAAGAAAPSDDCALPWSEGLDAGGTTCDLDNLEAGSVTLTGDIIADLTLETGKSYLLSGPTRVMSGAVLTIEPCVKIVGDSASSILAILPGSKIEAVGEVDAPIVFTSANPVGERRPGDWGGLMILGNARTNQATEIVKPAIEGLVQAELYGSHTNANNTESSGSLVYVRVEYAGKDLGANNEANGITFGAVGSGTTMHHVMVSNSVDDCFEWFGGTMNAHHLIAFNCDDDMFDTDHGYSGAVQFAFGRQFPTTSETDSNGFEMDTASPFLDPLTTEPIQPLTSAQWSNVTLCGQGPEEQLSPPRLGAVLRRRVAGSITNAIITGFADGGLGLFDDATIGMTHSLVFGNGRSGDQTYGSMHQQGDAWLSDQDVNATDAPAGFCDCWSNPPAPFPATTIEGGATTGLPDEEAGYVGAFKQADVASNWMIGKWVSWAND